MVPKKLQLAQGPHAGRRETLVPGGATGGVCLRERDLMLCKADWRRDNDGPLTVAEPSLLGLLRAWTLSALVIGVPVSRVSG